MLGEFGTLSLGAVTLGFLHCLFGPDHYVPFVAMARIGLWSLRKTLVITVLCGVGHILSSVLLGAVGIALGLIVYQLGTEYDLESDPGIVARLELVRGDVAAWLLLLFGLAYFLFGIVHAVRKQRARRAAAAQEAFTAGTEETSSGKPGTSQLGSMTPWVLFTIFLFGPCEPIIPLMIAPAAEAKVWTAVWIALLFGGSTIVTMTVIVAAMYRGTSLLHFRQAEVYGHALAGLVVMLCGLAMLLGL